MHEAAQFEGRDYLVTEFVDGGTLGTWARAETRTWRQVVELLIGVADALSTAHDAGILHRDIKPENVLVARNGYAKLADFGLAKVTDHASSEAQTATGSPSRVGVILGTIDYLSPEQARGGSSMPEVTCSPSASSSTRCCPAGGRSPGQTDLIVIDAVLRDTPPPLGDDVPLELRGVVEKALEKDPADRYQSMRDLVVDLRRLTRHSTVASTQARPRPVSRKAAALAAIAALVLLAGAAGWWRGAFTGGGAAIAPIRSIAVLPMDNLSADPNEELLRRHDRGADLQPGASARVEGDLANVGHAIQEDDETTVARSRASSVPTPSSRAQSVVWAAEYA